MKIETIHVYLPEESVDCWYPVRAEHLGDDRYRILDDAPDDPVWEFGKGDVVRCRIQKLAKTIEFRDALVAFEAVNSGVPVCCKLSHALTIVMAGLDPAIHAECPGAEPCRLALTEDRGCPGQART